jgi:hypothetical protein
MTEISLTQFLCNLKENCSGAKHVFALKCDGTNMVTVKLPAISGKFNISTTVNYSQKWIRKLYSYFFSVHDCFILLCKHQKESFCHNLLL